MSYRLAVLVSGEGTNLQAILDRVHGREGIEVACVASTRAGARGLERAEAAGVEARVFELADHDGDRAARDGALADWLESEEVDLVVLAGWMQILSPAFVARFRHRLINVHPSLLPAFAGLRPIEQALDHGVRVMGVTVHFVEEVVDSGPIILQQAFETPYARSVAEVEERVHEIEHELLPRAIRLLARGAVRIDAANPRLVVIDESEG